MCIQTSADVKQQTACLKKAAFPKFAWAAVGRHSQAVSLSPSAVSDQNDKHLIWFCHGGGEVHREVLRHWIIFKYIFSPFLFPHSQHPDSKVDWNSIPTSKCLNFIAYLKHHNETDSNIPKTTKKGKMTPFSFTNKKSTIIYQLAIREN